MLATRAAEAALADAGCAASDIDLIIVATSTPDYTFPAAATQVASLKASGTLPTVKSNLAEAARRGS